MGYHGNTTYNIGVMTFGIAVTSDINLRKFGELVEKVFHKKRLSFSNTIYHDFCDFKKQKNIISQISEMLVITSVELIGEVLTPTVKVTKGKLFPYSAVFDSQVGILKYFQ